MKIPFKTLKVGAQPFSFVEVGPEIGEDARMMGDTDARKNRVRIVQGQLPAVMGDTLIHEICHVILLEAGLPWSGPEVEIAIARVAPRIAALLADNPKQMHALIDVFQNEA